MNSALMTPLPSMPRVFRDPLLQQKFERDGFVVVRICSATDADELREQVVSLRQQCGFAPGSLQGTNALLNLSFCSDDVEYKRQVEQLVFENLARSALVHLNDYRCLCPSIIAKPPSDRPYGIHADWTLQEDLEWPSLHVWCALQDVSADNGAMAFIPGSHRLFNEIWGVESGRCYGGAEQLLASMAVSVPIEAGEAIIFDNSILHGSSPNRSDGVRVAAGISCIPTHRTGMLYFVQQDDPKQLICKRADCAEYSQIVGEDLWNVFRDAPVLAVRERNRCVLHPEQVVAVVQNATDIKSGKLSMTDVLSAAAPTMREESPSHSRTAKATFARRALRKARRGLNRLLAAH